MADELTRDMHAEPDDLRPRLAAAQIVGVIRVLYYEARRRLVADEPTEQLAAALSQAANTAFDQLQASLGDYGARADDVQPSRSS